MYKKNNIKTHVFIFESSFHCDNVRSIATLFKTRTYIKNYDNTLTD